MRSHPTPAWYVLTGRPSSGISTTLAAIAARGYRTVGEAARAIIDEGVSAGKTVAEIRGDDARFQWDVLDRKVRVESGLPRDETVFLDRALPDSIVYHAIAGLDPGDVVRLCRPGAYRKVFFLEPLPYRPDYARTESEQILDRLARELPEAYRSLGYDVLSVPVDTVPNRVKWMLQNL